MGEIAASGDDTSVARGKVVVLVVKEEEERQAFTDLLDELDITVHQASSGEDAVFLVEDFRPDLLIMEISLPDMHAWKLLVTLRERINIAGLPIIIIMDEHKVMPLDNITSIVRPVGLTQFRNTIRSLLNDNKSMDE